MKITVSIFAFLCISTLSFGLNLDSISQEERDSILKQLARTTVLLFGPDYYREGKTIIEKKNAESDIGAISETERDGIIKRNSPIFYSVTTYYDQTKELFSKEYVSKVYIWAIDPIPFTVFFGNSSILGFNENRGNQIRNISAKFNAHGDPTEISKESLKLGFTHMTYTTIPLEDLTYILKARNKRDSISKMMKLQKMLELERQMASAPSYDNKVWKKLFKAERKSFFNAFNKDLDRMDDILKYDIKYFNDGSSTEYGQFNTVKHFKKLKKRITSPTFVVEEKKISNLIDGESITSNMHYLPNEVNIYIGNIKNVFYRVTWKKIKDEWKFQDREFIPISLSKKLIESGLYKNRKKAETVVLQQDGKVKNLVFFKKRKKITFLDSKNFLNDYQSNIPNLKK